MKTRVLGGALRVLGLSHERLRQNAQLYMVLVSIAVGLLGGLGAVVFREFIRLGQVLFWRSGEYSLQYIRELPMWWKLAAPATGGLIVGLIIYYFASEAKGHGVPEVMESIVLRGGRIRPRVVLAKLVASGVCIASGGSVGREGPIVQIGSAIGSTVGQWLGIGERRLRTLVACGAAAGIAGTFNAPVAGALFAVEVILGDFGVAQFSPIVISSVAATVVSRHFLGDFPAFDVPSYSLVSPFELFAYAVLGVLAGLAALLFIRLLYGAEDLFDRLRAPTPLKAIVGGALVGLIALRFPEILGVGYEAINEALTSEVLIGTLLLLVLVKIVAVSLTIGSGGSGGIFAPSLFIGSMLGGAVGTVVHGLWPQATGSPGAYALVGMGAVVGAATHAPITAILIIFELTNDYKIILPLMITCITATLLATQLQRASIYTLKLLRRGVDIHRGQTVNVLRDLACRDVMRDDFEIVEPSASVVGVISSFMRHPGSSVFVVDGVGRLQGVITIDDIRPLMADVASLGSLVIAGDMMREAGFPVFHPEDSLDEIMQRFGSYQYSCPVVVDDMPVGAVWPMDVIERYNAEVFKREMASSMSLAVSNGSRLQALPGVHGVSLADVPVPGAFIGKTLAELELRRDFNLTVLLIRRQEEGSAAVVERVPDADSKLGAGDTLLVLGSEGGIRRLEQMP
jgi:CIC family chloride channel protein